MSLTPNSFKAYCLTEAIRLQESQLGPLDDRQAVRWARTRSASTFAERVQWRAIFLAKKETLDQALNAWLQLAAWLLIALAFIAIVAGLSSTLTALGDGAQPVNLFLALMVLLGLNTLSFIIWLASFIWPKKSNQGGLGAFWFWLIGKASQSRGAKLVGAAFIQLSHRQGGLRWLFAAVSHTLWLIALLAVVLTLLVLLSARLYTFKWETTLLSLDVFIWLTKAIGWLPAKLGFQLPSEALIQASDGQQPLARLEHAVWSSWLLGAIVVYGLLPRFIACVLSIFISWRALHTQTITLQQPYYQNLQARLQAPLAANTDGAKGAETIGVRRYQALPPTNQLATPSAKNIIAGLELGTQHQWPPRALHTNNIEDAGLIDSLEQRNALLDKLAGQAANKLLLVCDAKQTPDRGIIHLILDLGEYAQQLHIAFSQPLVEETPDHTAASRNNTVRPNTARQSRSSSTISSQTPIHPAWLERLQASGIDAQQIHERLIDGLNWLQNTKP